MTTFASKERITRVVYSRLWWVTLLTIAAAVAANVLLFFIGRAVGAFPEDYLVPASGMPFTVAPFILLTTVSVLAGCLVFALLGLFSRHPVRLYTIIGIVVLVLSFSTPFTLPAPPLLMFIFLQLTHIAAAASAILLPIRLAAAPAGASL